MFTTLLAQCVICLVLLVAAAIFIKAEPPTPPTHSQAIAVQRKQSKLSQRKESRASHNSTTVIVNASPDLPPPSSEKVNFLCYFKKVNFLCYFKGEEIKNFRSDLLFRWLPRAFLYGSIIEASQRWAREYHLE